MLIYVFPPHYQLVYISFDISSFSLISYIAKTPFLKYQNGVLNLEHIRQY